MKELEDVLRQELVLAKERKAAEAQRMVEAATAARRAAMQVYISIYVVFIYTFRARIYIQPLYVH